MATQAYRDWLAAGQPGQVAMPVQALAATLEHYGISVGVVGDTSHMQHDPPEDHTFFSATGWPISMPRWWESALDIMPHKIAGVPSVWAIAQQIYRDVEAGVPGIAWIKYMNRQDSDSGPAYQDSWKPGHARRSSNDRGHVHISGRSDRLKFDAAAAGYDPVARIRGGTTMSDLDYTGWAKPAVVGNRTAAVLLADVWGQELQGRSPFAKADEPGKSYRTLQLDRIEAAATKAVTVTLTPEDRAAIVADVIAGVLDGLGKLQFVAAARG